MMSLVELWLQFVSLFSLISAKKKFDDWSEKRQSFLYLNVLQGIKIILYNVNTIKKSNDGDYNANAISQ